MRIALVTEEMSYLGGGVYTVVEQLAQQLSHRGFDVCIFGISFDQQIKSSRGQPGIRMVRVGPSRGSGIFAIPSLLRELSQWKRNCSPPL